MRTTKTPSRQPLPNLLQQKEDIAAVLAEKPDVFNHNMETVPRLYPVARAGSRYRRSIDLLRDGTVTVVDDAPLPGRSTDSASLTAIAARMRLEGGVATLEQLSGALGSSTIAGRGSASPAGVQFSLTWDALKPAPPLSNHTLATAEQVFHMAELFGRTGCE